MRRLVIPVTALLLAGAAAWAWLGGVERVTAERVESALAARGVPQPMAECMAARMVDRLSIAQLRKLERLGARDGESIMPLSTAEALARIRRVDDPQAVEVAGTAAAVCAVGQSGLFR